MGNHQTVTTTSIKVEGRSLEQKLEANANLEKKDRKCVGREVCRVRNGCGQKEQNERRMGIGAGGLRWREDVLTHQFSNKTNKLSSDNGNMGLNNF